MGKSIHHVFDQSPSPPGNGHTIKGHIFGPDHDPSKSYFTDTNGAPIDVTTTLILLDTIKNEVVRQTRLKKDEEKRVAWKDGEVAAIKAKVGNYGYAVTLGKQVGVDQGVVCKWVCLVINATPQSGRHQWVSAFTATDTYVSNEKA